jgi:hypothetical protein
MGPRVPVLLEALKRGFQFRTIARVAKKFLFLSGPVGTSGDITSKSGFFASLFECNRELKRFLRYMPREFREKNLQNSDTLQLEVGFGGTQNDIGCFNGF